MSEVKLNLIDRQHVLHGTIHGSVADACVAALSAEPETVAELVAALARYIKPLDDHSPFAHFQASDHSSPTSLDFDAEPWDAGIVVIDLAARIVAVESTYSMPGPDGEVHYHDGTKSTDVLVRYRVPDDWLFVNSVESYQWSRERHAEQRLANPPFDAREILFGYPLLEFIVNECAPVAISESASNGNDTDEDAVRATISAIHARWLTTPREDLRGQSPREVLFARRDFISSDLDSRSLQWTMLDEGPPCLSPDSFAYRYAGFGIQEWVIYYDLICHLLDNALESVRQTSVCRDCGGSNTVQEVTDSGDLQNRQPLITKLEQLKTDWLEQPQPEYSGRVPAILIDNERKRLPIALRPRDMIIDDDCPVCQAFGDETTLLGMGVGFWHLDGSHMDDDFVFSYCKTREEWENENRRREEFYQEFDRRSEERKQRIARGEPVEHDPFLDPDPLPDFEFAGFSNEADKSNEDEGE